MRFPKLKHTVLCQLLQLIPGILFFLVLIALMIIAVPKGRWNTIAGILAMGTAVFSIWYLVHNFMFLMGTDILFRAIRQWRIDREEYVTDRNGASRQEVQRRILRRCRRWGREVAVTGTDTGIVCLRFRHSQSPTVFYSVVEKRLAICSVSHLDRETYSKITQRVCSQIKRIPDGRPLFKVGAERKAPIGRMLVVIILADTVDETVKKLARDKLLLSGVGYALPCVAECSTQRYYTDCTKEPYLAGMVGRPEKNYAADLVRRIVFAGRLPRENAATRPSSPLEKDQEQSFWEFIRRWKEESREENGQFEREAGKMLERLSDGQVRMGKHAIYCKMDKRIACCDFFPDEEDDRLLYLSMDDKWEVPRKMKKYPIRRKMKPAEREAALRRIKTWLTAEGYRIAEDDADN